MSDVTYEGELCAQALAQTLLHVEEWMSNHDSLEPVSEADVVEIVAQYEGYAVAEPIDFVERRRSLVLVS